MKETNFRALRREEKRKAFERKRARLQAARAKVLEEKQKKAREEKLSAAESGSVMPDTFVGRFEFVRRGGIVYTDSKLLKDNIIIPSGYMHDAQEGDKVVVKLFHRGSKRHMPEGAVLDVLGPDGDNNAEMNGILAEYGLPYTYPDVEVNASEEVTEDEVRRRRDMRQIFTFTIDPADAKDYDDAISFETLPDGKFEIGVHIADVTHYVRPETDVDEEAYNRGTSVYLVDRVVPMLPEILSNNICSLRPNEDKLTFSVILHMDANAKVLKYKICPTVIRSNYRLSYDEAQEKLDSIGTSEQLEACKDPLTKTLYQLNLLARILRKQRLDHGAVAFERDEVKFDLDEDGHPLAIHLKQAKESNYLIEEFMLLANRTVATHIGKELKKPFVYRVHDVPDPDKMERIENLARSLNFPQASSLKKMLSKAQDRPEKELLEQLAIRAMAKAVYSTNNIGHYGLAFQYYTHFTSPIRRYPDVMVHRLLKYYLNGEGATPNPDMLEVGCKHCSNREQLAASAERASVKYKQVEFMQGQEGKQFSGIVSGVTEWGLYVEIVDNQCEGLVPIRNLKPEDYYMFEEDNFCLRGRVHDRVFRLGDRLQVRLDHADLSRKQLDFSLI